MAFQIRIIFALRRSRRETFAPESELRPVEGTLQLRSANGSLIETYGRRSVQLVGSELGLHVSFVIANVSQALLGMDILLANQLSLIRTSLGEYYLVNNLGAKTKLQPRGLQLYMPAWPLELGLSTLRGSSLQDHSESLLDDKVRTQDRALATSGGACYDSLPLENLREQQAKNTATLGTTTACQEEGAKRKRRKKKKKPSAKIASQDPSNQRSFGQQGQQPAASSLRNSQKLRIMTEIELAAENPNSLSNKELQEISLRILLTLSLRQGWQLTMTRATTACSEDALQNHLRSLGLGQNKMDQHLFSGDELVILQHKRTILIAGSELQQEDLFCELSFLVSLDQTQKLGEGAQVSFCNRTLEHKASSNIISLALEPCFVHDLLCRHELEQKEPLGSLDEEEPCKNAPEQTFALDACRQELSKQSVRELIWATTACRPDLCFEVMQLTQGIDNPTTKHELQLHKVLRYLAGTLHYNLSLHTKIQIAKKEAENVELLAFSATSGTRACHSTALFLWDVPLITSCKAACAQNQDEAELQAVNLSLAMAVHSRKLLQQLDLDQLEKDVHIGLKTSSFHEEPVERRPIAMQLGLSRRNRHKQLQDQLKISRVHPYKNLAESLIYNASGEEVLAKLRIDTGAAETLALPTELCFASFVPSSSLVVGMVSLELPMEKPQLRQLALSESCNESLSKNLAERSLPSLTLPSLSLEKIDSDSLTLCSLSLPLSKGDRFSSLTEKSLSLTEANLDSLIFANWSLPTGSLTLDNLSRTEDRLQSLTLQSLSLNHENGLPRMSFEQVSLQDGSLKELAEHIANQNDKKRAETNSFSQESFQKHQLENKRAKTNGFSTDSFSRRILSLRMCLLIFLLGSFYLTGSALYLTTCSFKISFPTDSLPADQLVAAYRSIIQPISLQQQELAAAYSKKSFAQQSHQQEELWKASSRLSFQQESQKQDELQTACLHQLDRDTSLSFQCFSLPRCSKNTLESFNQLDLVQSLSFQMLGSISFSYQLQADSFNRPSFELRDFICAALLQTTRIRNSQLYSFQVSDLNSFQLTGFHLSNALASGGVQQTTSQNQLAAMTLTALSTRMSAWILHSLSLALGACKASSSKIAWSNLAFNKSLLTTSLSTTASHRTPSMGALQTRPLQTTSSPRSASRIAFAATSSRRAVSASALRTTSLSTTSSFGTTSCFSFLVHNFSFNKSLATCQLGALQDNLRQEQPCKIQLQHDSFSNKKTEKKDELQQNLLEHELEKVLATKTCSLGPYDHLEQKLWQIQLQELSLQQNNQKQEQQLSATVPDNKLLKLHLSQLCQQDPKSAFSRQLPEATFVSFRA